MCNALTQRWSPHKKSYYTPQPLCDPGKQWFG